MQIKVKDTRMHKLPAYAVYSKVLGNDSELTQNQQVPVVEGKLIFIPCFSGEAEIFVLPNGFQYMLKKYYVETLPHPIKWYKPIIISETEEIEVGDTISDGTELLTCEKQKTVNVFNSTELDKRGAFKVLALPEHFSPKQLQAIVDGKLKDGDKVLVECTTINSPLDTSKSPIVTYTDIIKLNSQNHITLHKIEEKMYPLSVVEEAFNVGSNFTLNCLANASKFDNNKFEEKKKRWFEQNVK